MAVLVSMPACFSCQTLRPVRPGRGGVAGHRRRCDALADRPGFTGGLQAPNLTGMNDSVARSAPVGEALSDEALMLAYARGVATGFDALYARHRTQLYRFLLRRLRDAALADDLFQDIWQKVIGAREGWQPDPSFTGWLYRIAHNRLNDHWRAQQHRPPAPDHADERVASIPDDDTPERQLSSFEQRRQIQLALDALPDDQREVILLRLEQELTLEEIGAVTGVGRETVKSRLRYAMDKLRRTLDT